jgi:hypothetical protein
MHSGLLIEKPWLCACLVVFSSEFILCFGPINKRLATARRGATMHIISNVGAPVKRHFTCSLA